MSNDFTISEPLSEFGLWYVFTFGLFLICFVLISASRNEKHRRRLAAKRDKNVDN